MCYEFPSNVSVGGILLVKEEMLDLRCEKNFPETGKEILRLLNSVTGIGRSRDMIA